LYKRKYGVALVGAGMVSAAHADSIVQLDETDLKLVYSRTEERARQFADRYGVPWTCDYGEVLGRDDIDIVDITTAPFCHADMGIEAARQGKHVIVEKPMDIRLEKCDALIEACQANGVKLAVIFQNRFKKAVRRAREYCHAGGLGQLLYGGVHVKWYRPQAYFDKDEWRGKLSTEGGGVLINQALHSIDLLLWVFGPVAEVYARTAIMPVHRNIEIENLAVINLKFRNGAMGIIEASTCLYPGLPERLELHGTRGTITLEQGSLSSWNIMNATENDEPGDVEEVTGTGASDPMAFPITWHKAQIQDMCDAITQDREPLVNGLEGRKSIELCRYIYESAEKGRPVVLS
jgi:UDP-N-acetyl-2-amino-2-deoxyglucuronate dehydrogenase